MPKHFLRALYMGFLALALLLSSCGSSRRVSRNNDSTLNSNGTKIKKADQKLVEKYETLGVKVNNQNIEMYRELDGWLGVPYKYGGTTKQGTDCSGFVSTFYSEVYKVDLPRSTDDQFKVIETVKQDKLAEGDLVFFKIEKGRKVSHVGIYLGNNKFVHASTSKGVRIDDITQEYYDKSFTGGGPVKIK